MAGFFRLGTFGLGARTSNGIETLDFLSGALDGRVTFTRASPGSYQNSADTNQTVSNNLTRSAHAVWDGYELRNVGLLYETAEVINLIAYSDDLSQSPWSLTFCSYTPATNTLTSASGGFARYSSTGLTTSAVHTFHAEIGAGSRSWVRVLVRDKAGSDHTAYVNLGTGEFGTTTGSATWATRRVKDFWQVCATVNIGAGATTPFAQIQFATENGSMGADPGDTIKVRRVNWHLGSQAAAHVATSGSTATRAAETLAPITSNFSSAGVWGAITGRETYLDGGTADQVLLFDWRADSDNRITISLDTDGAKTGDLTLTTVVGGVSSSVSLAAMSPGQYKPFQVAWRVSDSEMNIAVNGHAATAVVTTMPNLASAGPTFGGSGTRSNIVLGVGPISDATLEQYAGKPTQKHLILLIGQSNMAGRATYDSLGGHPDFVNQWNQSGVYTDATVPLDHVGQPGGSMGPDIDFATRYRLEYPDAELIFIPCAQGSTGFTLNHWNPGDTNYALAVSRTLAAISGVSGASLKGALWVQGEQDATASMSQAAYAAALDAMIASLRSALGNSALPFVAGQISPALNAGTFPTAPQINAALADLPNRVAYTACASSSGLISLPDGVHYSAANLRTLGSRLFDAWKTVV